MIRNPDKHIRKAFYDLVTTNSITTIWDMNVTGDVYPTDYIILSTQTKLDNQLSKCGGQWECSILLDLVTRFVGTGNTGSRVKVNDMEEALIANINSLSILGYDIFDLQLEQSTTFDNSNKGENIYRQLMRYRIVLNEI